MDDIKEILKVDRHNLHEEWERHPQIYMEWAEKWAKALFRRDKLKEKMELIKAKLDGQIRENPEMFGFTKKPTEAAISAAITKSDEYRKALNAFFKATEEVNLMASIKTSLEHRKKALEALTQLFIAGYYAEPTLSESELANAKASLHKKRQEEIRSNLRRNKRLTTQQTENSDTENNP